MLYVFRVQKQFNQGKQIIMPKLRKTHSASVKAKAALEAIKGHQTINELAGKYGVHPTQLSHWKKQLLSESEAIFSDKRRRDQAQAVTQEARLYEEIGRLKIELDWLKKKFQPVIS